MNPKKYSSLNIKLKMNVVKKIKNLKNNEFISCFLKLCFAMTANYVKQIFSKKLKLHIFIFLLI